MPVNSIVEATFAGVFDAQYKQLQNQADQFGRSLVLAIKQANDWKKKNQTDYDAYIGAEAQAEFSDRLTVLDALADEVYATGLCKSTRAQVEAQLSPIGPQ